MDIRKIIRLARRQGFAFDKTSRGHLRARAPNGAIVVTSGTPSDWRAIRNFVADLRRHGFRMDEHR